MYLFALALGRMHPDGSDSRLLVKPMPFGLLDYIASFSNADSYSQVMCTIMVSVTNAFI